MPSVHKVPRCTTEIVSSYRLKQKEVAIPLGGRMVIANGPESG